MINEEFSLDAGHATASDSQPAKKKKKKKTNEKTVTNVNQTLITKPNEILTKRSINCAKFS
jgi:hypothetical protein